MTRPSILFLSHEFPPLGGGAGINGLNVCEELHRRGFSVHVVTQAPPNAGLTPPRPFQVSAIPSLRKRLHQTSFMSMALFVCGAMVFHFQHRRRAFHCVFSNMAIPSGIAGAAIAALRHIPHIVWHHGSDVHAGKPLGAGFFQKFLLKAVWKNSMANCFVSQGLLRLAQTYGTLGNETIVPIAPVFPATPANNEPANPDYFIYIGRMEKVKNPLLLIEALKELKNRQVTPKVRFIGDGKLFHVVRKEILLHDLKTVSLQKNISHDRVPALLRSAYALICPSLIEGCNMTIIEAAHYQTPTIGADVPGINCIVTHHTTGLLFRGNCVGELALSIKELYENPSLRDILGKNAAGAAAGFSIARTADGFEEILSSKLF